MTSRKIIHCLYWALPIQFFLWELLCTKMPYIRDLFPQHIRDSIVAPPHSLAEAFAAHLVPVVYVFSTIWKYIYIMVCYLLRRRPVVVLIFTIFLVTIWVGVDYALYLPLERAGRSEDSYQVSLFHFIVSIIADCPFYLCVYFFIKRMNKANSTNMPDNVITS